MWWEKRRRGTKEQLWQTGQRYNCVVLTRPCSCRAGWNWVPVVWVAEDGAGPPDNVTVWRLSTLVRSSFLLPHPRRCSFRTSLFSMAGLSISLSVSVLTSTPPPLSFPPLPPDIINLHSPVLPLLPSPKSSYCTTMFVLYSQKTSEQKSLKSRAPGSFIFFCGCFSLSQL